ncbi:MAG: endonuclease III domain-containing protein [candidate division WOR-3 bacterium]
MKNQVQKPLKDFSICTVRQVYDFYHLLFKYYGRQYWWPAQSSFEVMVGAVLTQNTSWDNVRKAIANLKKKRLLSIHKINSLSERQLAITIKSAGFYRAKAKFLKALVKYLISKYNGKISLMKKEPLAKLRNELLNIYGIGKETADSILLYALSKPIFVVDAYTKRIFSRHLLIKPNIHYDELQKFMTDNLPHSIKVYKEYHALLVRLGKDFCRKVPKCFGCPLRDRF